MNDGHQSHREADRYGEIADRFRAARRRHRSDARAQDQKQATAGRYDQDRATVEQPVYGISK